MVAARLTSVATPSTDPQRTDTAPTGNCIITHLRRSPTNFVTSAANFPGNGVAGAIADPGVRAGGAERLGGRLARGTGRQDDLERN